MAKFNLNSYEKSKNLSEVKVMYKRSKEIDSIKISSSNDSYNYFKSVWDHDKIDHLEECIVLALSRQNKVLGWVKIAQGGGAGAVIDTRLIFQIALGVNASSIILAHNHPSGNLNPSEMDIRLTKKIVEAGKIMEIQLLDHLIIASEGYYSMADEGQM